MVSGNSNIRRIRRKEYEICIEEDYCNGTFVEITISPPNYSRNMLMNWIIVVVLNYICDFKILPSISLLKEYDLVVKICVFIVSILLFKRSKMEQITVIKDYGIQLTHWDGYLILPYGINKNFTQMREFIPRNKIVDVIINEGFYQWYQVIFYLCIMIRNETKLKIMFPGHIKMKLEDEKMIYQICQRYLYTERDQKRHGCV